MARPSVGDVGSPETRRRKGWWRQSRFSASISARTSATWSALMRRRGRHAPEDEARDVDRAGGQTSSLLVAMEACCGAHHLGRVFAAHGHDVRLMSPEYVRPYIKAQKNDDRDAEGSPRRRRARRCGSLN